MGIKIKFWKYCLLIIIIMGCKNTKTKKMDSYLFDVYFVQKGTSSPMSLGCLADLGKSAEDKGFFYKQINDNYFEVEFMNDFNKLTKSENQRNIDTRITLYLKHSQIKTDTLCFGQNHGTMLNGVRMNDSKQMLKKIKDKIEYNTTYR